MVLGTTEVAQRRDDAATLSRRKGRGHVRGLG